MALRKEDLGDQATRTTKRSRITIDINPELRRRIKIAALQHNLSISDYLAPILEQSVPKEAGTMQRRGHPITREGIDRLRRLRKKITQENEGGPFEDSTELLRQQREERTRYLMGEL
jgi:hypothetical protein